MILVVANAFWLLLLLPNYLYPDWRSPQFEQQPMFTAPSEEALTKLEVADINSDEISSLMRDANATGISWRGIMYYLDICNNLIENGNANRSVFNSCGSLLWSTENNLQSVIDESWTHIEMINSTLKDTIE